MATATATTLPAQKADATGRPWLEWLQDALPLIDAAALEIPRSSRLAPLLRLLPPPDMRLPTPLKKLDPELLRLFELQHAPSLPNAPPRRQGGPTPSAAPAQADASSLPVASRASSRAPTPVESACAPASVEMARVAEGSPAAAAANAKLPAQRPEGERGSKSEKIKMLAKEVYAARPAHVAPQNWVSDPTDILARHVARQLVGSVEILEQYRTLHASSDQALDGLLLKLIKALQSYDEKLQKRKAAPSESAAAPVPKRVREL